MRRVAIAFLLLAIPVGCQPAAPTTQPAPVVPAPVVPPPSPPTSPPTPKGLSATQVAGRTFIYNHQLVDGSLEGPAVRLAPDGKLSGIPDQTGWKLEDGVLCFTDDGGAVRSRFDKVYTGPAGLFFLGHRSNDNKYHTLIELPPTK